MGFLDNFEIKTKYGALAAMATPMIIVGGLYVAYTYSKMPRFSRSLSMGALQGGQLALERMVHHHKARIADVLDNLKKQLSDPQPDFRSLQVTISLIEVNGKEGEAAKILKDKRNQLNEENKRHEAYEIEMLLVELLIYQGQYKEALQCDCLNDTQISDTDARGPLFTAIIGILTDLKIKGEPPEKYWDTFIEIRSHFQFPPGFDREVDEVVSDFNKFSDAVKLLTK